jgi:hypothetical protein
MEEIVWCALGTSLVLALSRKWSRSNDSHCWGASVGPTPSIIIKLMRSEGVINYNANHIDSRPFLKYSVPWEIVINYDANHTDSRPFLEYYVPLESDGL